MRQTLYDSEVELRLALSESPPTVDGLAIDEPKAWECPHCSASIPIDRDPSEGGKFGAAAEELPHDAGCPNRGIKTDWWWRQFGGD